MILDGINIVPTETIENESGFTAKSTPKKNEVAFFKLYYRVTFSKNSFTAK